DVRGATAVCLDHDLGNRRDECLRLLHLRDGRVAERDESDERRREQHNGGQGGAKHDGTSGGNRKRAGDTTPHYSSCTPVRACSRGKVSYPIAASTTSPATSVSRSSRPE